MRTSHIDADAPFSCLLIIDIAVTHPLVRSLSLSLSLSVCVFMSCHASLSSSHTGARLPRDSPWAKMPTVWFEETTS